MPDYNITEEQKSYLNSLICQRISEDDANRQIIELFENPDSSLGITNALKTGWNADKQDKVAYYIIKDPADNQPMLFFSLKCGELHKPLNPARLDKSVTQALMRLQAAASRCEEVHMHTKAQKMNFWEYFSYRNFATEMLRMAHGVEVEEWAEDVIERQLVDGELPDKAWDEIWDRLEKSLGRQTSYKLEMKLEGSNIIRTKQTFAAVELVHFCAHKAAQDKWEAMKMGQSLGRAMFWQFVEPKIRKIRALVGCEYVYLFAADNDRNGSLVNLYKGMGFEFREDLYVTKPAYDFQCYFMCRKAVGLRTRKNEFFKNFNKPREKKHPRF